jgi:hypothetical protein
MVNAKAFLEKRYSEDMELEDAIHTALLTLKEGFEGEGSRSLRGCDCVCRGLVLRRGGRAARLVPAFTVQLLWPTSLFHRSHSPCLNNPSAPLPCSPAHFLSPLRNIAAGELSGDNIEVAVVGEDRVFRVLTPAEVTDYLQEVE